MKGIREASNTDVSHISVIVTFDLEVAWNFDHLSRRMSLNGKNDKKGPKGCKRVKNSTKGLLSPKSLATGMLL